MEENVNVYKLVADKLNSCDMWFTTKSDPTVNEAPNYYKLDEYGEPTDNTIKKIEKEVNGLIGDGAVDLYDAIELWVNDALVDCKVDYKDNLVTVFADKPVVDNIEAYRNPVQFPSSKKIEGKKLQEHTETILKVYSPDNYIIKPFIDLFKEKYPDKSVDKVYLEIVEGGWQPCVAYIESGFGTYRVFVGSLNDGIYMSNENDVRPSRADFKRNYDYVEESKEKDLEESKSKKTEDIETNLPKYGGRDLADFKAMLQTFDKNGRFARRGSWSIGNGGYDLYWEIYYNKLPVIRDVAGKVENETQDEIYEQYAKLVADIYNEKFVDNKVEESKKTEYYKMPDDEHIIWDSESSYEDYDVDEMKELYKDNIENGNIDTNVDFETWFSNYVIDDSENMWRIKEEDLDENILPAIDRQLNHNVLLLSGNYGSNYADFRPSGAGGVMWKDGTDGFKKYMGGFDDRVCITTRNGMLGAICNDHDGTVSGQFYTLPSNEIEFLKVLGYEDRIKEEYSEEDLDKYNHNDLMMQEFENDLYYDGIDARDLNSHIDLLVPIKDNISGYTTKSESKRVKTEDINSTNPHYIAKCTLISGDEEFPDEYILLDNKDSNGESCLDIILSEDSMFNNLWYNTDFKVKDLEIVKEVFNLDELVDYMKSVGVDLSSMRTEVGIEVGNDDMLPDNLNHYIKDEIDESKGKINEDKVVNSKVTEAEDKLYLDDNIASKLEKATDIDFSKADIDILKIMYKRLDDLVINIYDNRNADNIDTTIKNILSKADVLVNKLPITTTLNEAFNLALVVRSIVGSKLEETFGYDFYYESKKTERKKKQIEFFKNRKVNFNSRTKDKVDENYQKRLDEVNNKSKGIIDDMVSKEDFDETSAYGKIIMRTSNMFNALSDNGYDVDVTFDNGESTSAIQLGPQGGKITITITDANKPLKAFTAGNFEVNDDIVEILKDVQNILDTL